MAGSQQTLLNEICRDFENNVLKLVDYAQWFEATIIFRRLVNFLEGPLLVQLSLYSSVLQMRFPTNIYQQRHFNWTILTADGVINLDLTWDYHEFSDVYTAGYLREV